MIRMAHEGGRGKVALGISLMENFTAQNVARGRLTVRHHVVEHDR